jgi:hypothetical protein
MKRFYSILFLACVLFGLNSRGALTAFGTLSTVDTATTNSVSLQTNSANVALGTFIVSHNGLTSTNALAGSRQFSVDGTNWLSLGTAYGPSLTNASSDTLSPVVISIPIYLRLSVTTTNPVQVGAVYLP